MKCSILTFFFAHNYGAVLQCYALKQYVASLGCDSDVISYVPESINRIYEINPFKHPVGVKAFLRKCLSLRQRCPQFRSFNTFIRQELSDNKATGRSALEKAFSTSDVVICGSDQIWNDTITEKDTSYFAPGEFKGLRKISYAASFGTKELSAFQQRCVSEYLPDFYRVSLREEDGAAEIEAATGKKPAIVLDPVFLLDRDQWAALAEKASIKLPQHYLLYYALKNNEELIRETERIAEEKHLELLVVHPIGKKQPIRGRQLYHVGPYEFLKLVMNADCISTGSFHATAFSIIFGKKYFHIRDSAKESRVESVLNRVNAYSTADEDGILNLGNIDFSLLNTTIEQSKAFLKEALS